MPGCCSRVRLLTKLILKEEGFVFFCKEKVYAKKKRLRSATAQGDFLHILDGSGKQALFGNFRKAPHTTIPEPM